MVELVMLSWNSLKFTHAVKDRAAALLIATVSHLKWSLQLIPCAMQHDLDGEWWADMQDNDFLPFSSSVLQHFDLHAYTSINSLFTV